MGVLPASRQSRIEMPTTMAARAISTGSNLASFADRLYSQRTTRLAILPVSVETSIWVRENISTPSDHGLSRSFVGSGSHFDVVETRDRVGFRPQPNTSGCVAAVSSVANLLTILSAA